MPKVEYSKSKGLVQSTGSGFVMAAETLTTAGAADPGVALTICNAGADNIAITLADGTSVGQLKWFVSVAGNDSIITPATTNGAYSNISLDNAGESVCLVWSGTTGWALLSRGSGATNVAANAVAGLPAIA